MAYPSKLALIHIRSGDYCVALFANRCAHIDVKLQVSVASVAYLRIVVAFPGIGVLIQLIGL